MRITPQQIQIKLNDPKTTAKMPVLNTGDVLQGKILSIQAGAIVLQLNNGSTLLAEVAQSERFVEGQILDFEVVDKENDLVKITIQNESNGNQKLSLVKSQLMTIDLKPTEENIKAFDILKTLGLNVTKDNIQVLSQNFKFLSTVFEQIVQDKILSNAVIPTNTPQESTVNISQNPLSDASTQKETSEVMLSTLENTSNNQHTSERMDLKSFSQSIGFENEQTLKEANLKEVVVKMLQNLPDEKGELPKLSREAIRSVLGLVSSLSASHLDLEDTMNKMGQLMKLEKPINFKNISILDKLNLDNMKINVQIEQLMMNINENEVTPKLLSLLKGFKMQSFNSDDEVKTYFNQLLEELSSLKEHTSSRVRSSAEMLMNSVRFLEKDQNNISWIQIPLQWQDNTKTLDIYVKSDKKENNQITKDHAKILIALNTNYIKEVQAYIQIKQQYLDICFTVQSEEIKKLFDSEIKSLKNDFENKYQNVKISVKNDVPMSFSEFVDDGQSHHINITV